ncbi:unnamed protein product [Cladocopium goreaui]|uniref:Uncharacterized protein n=1 Tax=Cladocopium goreaui TaxID=2562237 RepID=A0A9P1CX77_9DINO|nr:unnamed protein product [Cladocopium goreaui]
MWSYCCSETTTGVLDAGSTLPEDKGFVRSVDTIGRRWGEGPVVSRRCNCKADNEESTDNSESDSEESPGTTLYLRENNASREFASASWRENAKKKHQLGPPDTQLFASGLATLTSQLPQKSHPTWITMKERLKRVSMEVKLSVDQTKLWFQVHAVSICASPLVAFSFFLNFVQLVR